MQFGSSEALMHWARYRPESIAIHGDRTVSYREFNQWVNSIAERICAAPDGPVAVAVTRKSWYLAAVLAAVRARRSAIMLNIRLSDRALQTNLADTGARVLVRDSAHTRIASLFPNGGCVDQVEISDASLAHGGAPVGFDDEDGYGAQPQDPWGIFFSSGTTGVPKGIERNHESVATELIGWCIELGLHHTSMFYIGRPVFYTGGMVLALATLLAGATVVLDDAVNDDDFDSVFRDFRTKASTLPLKYAFFIPDQLRFFTKASASTPDSSFSRVTILTMGSPIAGWEKVAVAQALGTDVIESWGNSESLGTITDAEDLRMRPNSVGRPFLTDRMYVVDDNGATVPAGTVGWLAGGQEGGFSKYSNRPDDTTLARRHDLIVSEDVGWCDDDGYLYVSGRMQEALILDTKTIFLPNLEARVRAVEGVTACCVVPVHDTERNVPARLVYLIVGSVDEERIRTIACEEVGDRVNIDVHAVRELPLGATGKLDRKGAQLMALALGSGNATS